MTHPNREELAGRLMFHGRYAHETEREAAIRRNAEREEAAAALRQSPSVEEVARVIAENVKCDASGLAPAVASVFLTGIDEAAREIDKLYQRGGG